MFTPQQYRAKAAEYAALVKTASNSDEAREFRKLEISFAALAANSQWMADNQSKTVHRPGPVTAQEKDDKDLSGAVNRSEKSETSAVPDAAAIANWNDEGGAPPAPAQRQGQQQRPLQAAGREQADR